MKEKIIEFKLNKFRLIIAAIGVAGTIMMDVIMPEEMFKFAIAVGMIFVVGGLLDVRLHFKWAWLLWFPVAAVMSFSTVIFTQLINNFPATLPVFKMLLCMEAGLVFILLFKIVFLVFCRRQSSAAKAAIIVGSLVLMVLAVINFYTANTRGTALRPMDVNAIGTTLVVLDRYEFSVTTRMWQAIVFFAAAIFAITGISTENSRKRFVNPLCTLLLTAAVLLHINAALPTIEVEYWGNNGCRDNGLMLNLLGQLKQSFVSKPQNYDYETIASLEEHYGTEQAENSQQYPDIIVVMNESFADLKIWGNLESNIPVTPFYDSMHENTIKGYAAASIIGGTTPNSEYEFLSGNSLLLHPTSAVPFEQYIKSQSYCIENYLADLGYESYFTHPLTGGSWSRREIYPFYGFDELVFDEGYVGANKVKGNVSDMEVYNNLIARYEKAGDKPLFMFTVTLQNHSPYTSGNEFAEPVKTEYSMPEADVYFSSIHESDKALEKLITYFENIDKPVVILFFGDHHPYFTEDLGAIIRGKDCTDGFVTGMTQYKVPFVIWTNYDIEEKTVELTSLNFLSNYLLEAADIPLSPYNRFLKDVEQVIPSMNAYGYWSNSKGGFAKYKEATGEEKEWLEAYEILQYNSMFDKEHRSEVFFR